MTVLMIDPQQSQRLTRLPSPRFTLFIVDSSSHADRFDSDRVPGSKFQLLKFKEIMARS